MLKHIQTTQEFNTEANEGLVLVDFFATWCGPCRMLGPVLEGIADRNLTKAKILKVDVDQLADVASTYRVQVIPTLVLLKDGEVVKRATGYMPEAKILEFIGE